MKATAEVLDVQEFEYLPFYDPVDIAEIREILEELNNTPGVHPSDIRMLTFVAKQVLYHARASGQL